MSLSIIGGIESRGFDWKEVKTVEAPSTCEKIADYARVIFLGLCWGIIVCFAQLSPLPAISAASLAGLAISLHMIIQGI